MDALQLVVAGHVALIALSLLVLSAAPLRHGRRFAWPRRRELEPMLLPLALVVGVLIVHVTEVRLDAWVPPSYAYDATRDVAGIEGTGVAWFQQVVWPVPVQDLFLLVYLFGYPFLIYFTPAFLVLHRDRQGLSLFALGFAALYAMALPFYLFLPVQNPWLASTLPWWQGPHIEFMLQRRWPEVVPMFWSFTTPNNVIPSLHAGMSALCAFVTWRSGHKRFALLAGSFALLIPPASFFVGVHWLMDPLVAYAMLGVALLLALRWQPRFRAWAEHQGAGPRATADGVAAELDVGPRATTPDG